MCLYINVFLILRLICAYYLKNVIAVYHVESEIPTQIVMSV